MPLRIIVNQAHTLPSAGRYVWQSGKLTFPLGPRAPIWPSKAQLVMTSSTKVGVARGLRVGAALQLVLHTIVVIPNSAAKTPVNGNPCHRLGGP